MKKHELEARLRSIRREKERLEQDLHDLGQSERNSRLQTQMRAYREARERQESTWWGKTKWFFGIDDAPLPSVGEALGTFVGASLDSEMSEQLQELELEEGRILDELGSLGSETPLTLEQKRAVCQEEIRKLQRDKAADLERLRADGCEESSVRYRENMWDDGIREKEEQLRKLIV